MVIDSGTFSDPLACVLTAPHSSSLLPQLRSFVASNTEQVCQRQCDLQQ